MAWGPQLVVLTDVPGLHGLASPAASSRRSPARAGGAPAPLERAWCPRWRPACGRSGGPAAHVVDGRVAHPRSWKCSPRRASERGHGMTAMATMAEVQMDNYGTSGSRSSAGRAVVETRPAGRKATAGGMPSTRRHGTRPWGRRSAAGRHARHSPTVRSRLVWRSRADSRAAGRAAGVLLQLRRRGQRGRVKLPGPRGAPAWSPRRADSRAHVGARALTATVQGGPRSGDAGHVTCAYGDAARWTPPSARTRRW